MHVQSAYFPANFAKEKANLSQANFFHWTFATKGYILCQKRGCLYILTMVCIIRINFVSVSEDMLYNALSSLGFVTQYST